MKLSRKDLAIILFFTVVLSSGVTFLLTLHWVVSEANKAEPTWITIKGYVTSDHGEPIAHAQILAFVGGRYHTEIPYVFSIYDAYTNDEGFYSFETPVFRDYIEVICSHPSGYSEEGLVLLKMEDAVVDWGTHKFFNQNFTIWR